MSYSDPKFQGKIKLPFCGVSGEELRMLYQIFKSLVQQVLTLHTKPFIY